MRFSIDLETACDVEGCAHRGSSMCPEKHSLSPWHSKITVAAAVREDGSARVFRGTNREICMQLSEYLTDDPNYEVVGHNFKFDWLHLARRGFEIPLERWTGDSNLAAYVLTEKIPDSWLLEYEVKRLQAGSHHRRAGKHSLKTLAPYFLGVEPFWEAADHNDDEYVIKDALYSLQLTEELERRLKARDQFSFYKNKQLEWTKMLAEGELRGITLDERALTEHETELKVKAVTLKDKLDKLWAGAHKAYASLQREQTSLRYTEMAKAALAKLKDERKYLATAQRYEALAAKAFEKLPASVDYDSPAQMAWLLRDYYGYDITSLEGSESTGKEVLERLGEQGHADVKTYLEWRKTNKILTAFLPTYRELATNSLLHPIFNVAETRTGRTSSERPNCQQVPPSLRRLFIPRPGYRFIGYDQAAIEAKLIALYTEDPTLYKIIESGTSLHDFNTITYFELDAPFSDVKEKYPLHRKAAKNVGFALFYNAGINRIRIAFAQAGFPINRDQATRIHKRAKEAYKVAFDVGLEVVRYLEDGNTMVNLLGRPLSIEHPEDAYMKAFNKLISSSASDLNLHVAHQAKQQLRDSGIDATLLLSVHDFVLFEVEQERTVEADEIIKRELTNFELTTRHGPIHLELDGGIMDYWQK